MSKARLVITAVVVEGRPVAQNLLAALARWREDLAWCLAGTWNAQPSSALANTPQEADRLVSAGFRVWSVPLGLLS